MSEATEEQADALLGHSDVEMAPATPEVVVAPQLQQPRPKRPSGAEMRRRKRQREAGSRSTGETVSGSVTVTPSQTRLPALDPLTAGIRKTEKAIVAEASREVQCATPREEPVAAASVAQTATGGKSKESVRSRWDTHRGETTQEKAETRVREDCCDCEVPAGCGCL